MDDNPETLEGSITRWFGMAIKNPIVWIVTAIIGIARGGLAGIPATIIVVPILSIVYGTVFGTIAWLGRDRR